MCSGRLHCTLHLIVVPQNSPSILILHTYYQYPHPAFLPVPHCSSSTKLIQNSQTIIIAATDTNNVHTKYCVHSVHTHESTHSCCIKHWPIFTSLSFSHLSPVPPLTTGTRVSLLCVNRLLLLFLVCHESRSHEQEVAQAIQVATH